MPSGKAGNELWLVLGPGFTPKQLCDRGLYITSLGLMSPGMLGDVQRTDQFFP